MPLVVIFGRTNVGKSTLFNALVEKKQAIVSDIAGTTRDSNINIGRWGGLAFELVDTGGIINPDQEILFKKPKGGKEVKTVDEINVKVQKQAVNFLEAADLVAKHQGVALERAYQRAVARAFNLRFKVALGFRGFRASPAFTAVTALLALKPVERALHWALLHMT